MKEDSLNSVSLCSYNFILNFHSLSVGNGATTYGITCLMGRKGNLRYRTSRLLNKSRQFSFTRGKSPHFREQHFTSINWLCHKVSTLNGEQVRSGRELKDEGRMNPAAAAGTQASSAFDTPPTLHSTVVTLMSSLDFLN